jgi:hypothetical protein
MILMMLEGIDISYTFYMSVLGDGSDAQAFCVSMTSKAMINVTHKVQNWAIPMVLHMDCIFKLTVIIGATCSCSECINCFSSYICNALESSSRFEGPSFLVLSLSVTHACICYDKCYFHIKKACKNKLRGNAEKGVILQDIDELHLMLTQEQFDIKFTAMFNCWLVNSSMFALHFYKQWVQGEFK